ncbi:MAG TPA: hypothetical protein VKZ49_05255 [Polyangiaceae bacterium]|nr:hypothetical protein [Polyangiaceae bacterium]
MLTGELEWALATLLTLDLLFLRWWLLRHERLRPRVCLSADAERLGRAASGPRAGRLAWKSR